MAPHWTERIFSPLQGLREHELHKRRGFLITVRLSSHFNKDEFIRIVQFVLTLFFLNKNERSLKIELHEVLHSLSSLETFVLTLF